MPKSYRHLTYEDRCQIEALKKSGLSIALIAEQLGRNRATAESVVTVTSRRRSRHAAGLPRPSQLSTSATPKPLFLRSVGCGMGMSM